jgi:hypothetical protein
MEIYTQKDIDNLHTIPWKNNRKFNFPNFETAIYFLANSCKRTFGFTYGERERESTFPTIYRGA